VDDKVFVAADEATVRNVAAHYVLLAEHAGARIKIDAVQNVGPDFQIKYLGVTFATTDDAKLEHEWGIDPVFPVDPVTLCLHAFVLCWWRS
jgi:hypothetical protein